jgi:tetratricopeptide (TPR) repeat protein
LKGKIPQKNCEVVIGFTAQNCEKENFSGATICYGSYIILRWIRSEDLMKKTLIHEFCNLFGGIDLYQEESIMNHTRAGDGFDEFTCRVILTNKFRRFEPQVFPLPEAKIDEAISHYESRKDLNRDEHEIHLILALLYIEKKDYDLAARECQDALRVSPGLPEAYTLLGTVYQKMGKIEQATWEYKRILISNGASTEVSFNLGIFYLERGKIDEAINEFQREVKENPNSAEAFRQCQIAERVNPVYKSIYEEVQGYLLRKKDYVLAYEFLKKVERR